MKTLISYIPLSPFLPTPPHLLPSPIPILMSSYSLNSHKWLLNCSDLNMHLCSVSQHLILNQISVHLQIMHKLVILWKVLAVISIGVLTSFT